MSSRTESAVRYTIDFDTETPLTQAGTIETAMEKVRSKIESIGNGFINYKNRLVSSIQAIGESVQRVYSEWKSKIGTFFSGIEFQAYSDKLKRFSQMMFGYGEAWEEHKSTVSQTLDMYEESLATLTGMEKVWVNIKLKAVSYWGKLIEVGREHDRRLGELQDMEKATKTWKDRLSEVYEITKSIAGASPPFIGGMLAEGKIRELSDLALKGYSEDQIRDMPYVINQAKRSILERGLSASAGSEYRQTALFLGEKGIKKDDQQGYLENSELLKRGLMLGDMKEGAELLTELNRQWKIAPGNLMKFATGVQAIGSESGLAMSGLKGLLENNEAFSQQIRGGEQNIRRFGIELTAIAGAFEKAGASAESQLGIVQKFRDGIYDADQARLIFSLGGDVNQLQQLAVGGQIGKAMELYIATLRRSVDTYGGGDEALARRILGKEFGVDTEFMDRIFKNPDLEKQIAKLVDVGMKGQATGEYKLPISAAGETYEATQQRWNMQIDEFNNTMSRKVLDPLANFMKGISDKVVKQVESPDGRPGELKQMIHLAVAAGISAKMSGLLDWLKNPFGGGDAGEQKPMFRNGRMLVDVGDDSLGGGGGILGAIGKIVAGFFTMGFITKLVGLSPIKKILFDTGSKFFGDLAARAAAAGKPIQHIWSGIQKIFDLFTGPSLLSKVMSGVRSLFGLLRTPIVGFMGLGNLKTMGWLGRLGWIGAVATAAATGWEVGTKLRNMLNNWTGGKFDEWIRKVSPLFILWKYIIDKINVSKTGGENFGVGTTEEKAESARKMMEQRRIRESELVISPVKSHNNERVHPETNNKGDQVVNRFESVASHRVSKNLLNENKLLAIQNQYGDLTEKFGNMHKVDPKLLQAMILKESSGDQYAVSKAGAKGLMQFMPATGGEYGLKTDEDFYNPEKNIEAGARYMRWLLDKYQGDENKALSFYNGGGKNPKVFGGPGNEENDNYAPGVLSYRSALEELEAKIRPVREVRMAGISEEKAASVAPVNNSTAISQRDIIDMLAKVKTATEEQTEYLKNGGLMVRLPDSYRDVRRAQTPISSTPMVDLLAAANA